MRAGAVHPILPQAANPIRHRRYPLHPKIGLPVASRVCRWALIIARFFMVFATDRIVVAEAGIDSDFNIPLLTLHAPGVKTLQ